MSFILKQALASDQPAEAFMELAQKGGLYYKGVDMAVTLSGKIISGEPYYPPIFTLQDDHGMKKGFLDHLGVQTFDEIPQSEHLKSAIGSVALVTVEKTSQLRPHELEIVGSLLPAVRVLFIEHGQTLA